MSQNFHERQFRPDFVAPSSRSTGYVFSGVAALLAVLFREESLWAVLLAMSAAVFLILATLRPNWLNGLNRRWFALSILLARIVNPVVLLALFALVIAPYGLLMQLFHDPLNRRRRLRNGSYWIERRTEPERSAGSSITDFKAQF